LFEAFEKRASRQREIMKASWSWTGLLVLGWTSAVAAQPTARLALTWSGPPGCPTTENVQARIDALLGGDASASSVADVRASGQVERVDSGYRLLLSMGVGSTPSSRVIEARTCDELAGAAAIAIALLARSTLSGASASSTGDSTTTSAPTADGRETPPSPAAQPERQAPAENEKEKAAGQSGSTRARLVLDAPIGVVGWGSLPSAELGLAAAVGVRWKALRASVRGELWQPQTNQVSGFATRFTSRSARAEACLVQDFHGLELGPCLGAAVQRLAGAGVGSRVFAAKAGTAVWVSGALGVFASLPTPGFEHLRFFTDATVLVSPVRPRFVIDQLGPVHEPSLAAPRVDLGCEWIF
jgi:hypothetical protein